jgi:microcystin-dependent protein
MMTMVRGSNPIWFEVDLTAHAFDDTFYLFILDNEIPYAPSTVWQDPFGNVEWTDPIRFLANGTLPNNIYYDPDTVYRLEFRQGPTQQDPLIYLVENYVPGSSGDTPITETSFSTDNQISNPQFSILNFVSPLVLTNISTQVIKVAPNWFLHLTGSGNVTLTQVLLNSTAPTNETNASYALEIQLSGSWTNAYLSQRFNANGVLWSNTFVSSVIQALASPAPQSISATLVDSQGNTLTSVLPTTSLSTNFVAYPGLGQISASINTDFPPTAYIEYQLLLPNNCDITLTSVQLISGDTNVAFPYEQITVERQIDHMYHNAYPVVPIGAVIDFAGYINPIHFFLCDGSAYSRITNQILLRSIVQDQSVSLVSGSNTFSLSVASTLYIGIPLEGPGIPASTVVTNISGTTVTISNNATVTGVVVVTFFPWGNGDGSTTFNVPNLQGYTTAGANGSIFPTNGVGFKGGANTGALVAANLPAHTHKTTVPVQGVVGGFGYAAGTATTTQTFTSDGGQSLANVPLTTPPTPFSLVQQTALMRKFIRYE